MTQFRFTLKHIEALVAIANEGSFRGAARKLNTTQPNISNRIAQLEETLGYRLMDRDAGSVRLTARGQAILGSAREILRATDSFVEASGDETRLSGLVRLGVTELIAHTWLPHFMREMRQRFPAVDIDLTVDLSVKISDALFNREVDVALQNAPFDRTASETMPLGQSEHIWVAAPSFEIPNYQLDDRLIGGLRVLAHSRLSAIYQQIDEHFRSLPQPVRLVSCSNMGTCLQMAIDGLGLACLPATLVIEPLSDGRLHRVDYHWTPDNLVFFGRYLASPVPFHIRKALQIAQRMSFLEAQRITI